MSIELLTKERSLLYDHCGIVGILTQRNSYLFDKGYAALEAEQTRGYDGAGMVGIREDGSLLIHKGEGVVGEVFKEATRRRLDQMDFYSAQFQVRYGTSGEYNPQNVQPFISRHCEDGELFVVSHNGQFSRNPAEINLDKSDSLLFVEKLANTPGDSWTTRISRALMTQKGAWSLIISTQNSMYLTRGERGERPLYYGKQFQDGEIVFAAASETIALNKMGFNEIQEVMPGELIELNKGSNDVVCQQIFPVSQTANCIFEDVYIMNENGRVFAPRSNPREVNNFPTIGEMRYKSGQILASEFPLTRDQIDVVIGVPGTGIAGAMGYADTLGLPYEQLITDRNSQETERRTFMMPEINSIYKKVMEHFDFDESRLRGKRVALGDDSMVRGNVSMAIAKLLREEYGVLAVYYLIFCPPIDKPCHLGVNTRSEHELIAARHKGKSLDISELTENIRAEIGVDGVAFLSDHGLIKALGVTSTSQSGGFCMGCMYGHKHPIGKRGEEIL